MDHLKKPDTHRSIFVPQIIKTAPPIALVLPTSSEICDEFYVSVQRADD
ncbi:MAG: hypothetical protein ACI892_001666 [Marinobacter maritimus]|jgi:hypothetical protein